MVVASIRYQVETKDSQLLKIVNNTTMKAITQIVHFFDKWVLAREVQPRCQNA